MSWRRGDTLAHGAKCIAQSAKCKACSVSAGFCMLYIFGTQYEMV